MAIPFSAPRQPLTGAELLTITESELWRADVVDELDFARTVQSSSLNSRPSQIPEGVRDHQRDHHRPHLSHLAVDDPSVVFADHHVHDQRQGKGNYPERVERVVQLENSESALQERQEAGGERDRKDSLESKGLGDRAGFDLEAVDVLWRIAKEDEEGVEAHADDGHHCGSIGKRGELRAVST